MTTDLVTHNKELIEKLSILKETKSTQEILQGLKTQERIDKVLIILLDTSDSMADRIESLRKIDVAWRIFQDELMPNMSGWTYGVIIFSSSAYWNIFPTPDTSALKVLQSPVACGNTSMGKGLQIAWTWVKINAKQARFIMLTDGQPNDMSKETILEMARANSSIPIDTVGIGSGTWDYDPNFLRELSSITGGIFSEANSVKLLAENILKLSPSQRPLLGMIE